MKLHVLDLKSGATELNDVDDTDTIGALKQKLFEASLIDVEPSKQRRFTPEENSPMRKSSSGKSELVTAT